MESEPKPASDGPQCIITNVVCLSCARGTYPTRLPNVPLQKRQRLHRETEMADMNSFAGCLLKCNHVAWTVSLRPKSPSLKVISLLGIHSTGLYLPPVDK